MYKAGFATTQEAYEAAVIPLFASLDRLEKLLAGKDFLVGNTLTEADVRLFVTIIRFDVAYFGIFKCNLRSIRDGYPAIHLYVHILGLVECRDVLLIGRGEQLAAQAVLDHPCVL